MFHQTYLSFPPGGGNCSIPLCDVAAPVRFVSDEMGGWLTMSNWAYHTTGYTVTFHCPTNATM